ncbi:Ser/Thr protein kinase L [Mycobacterium tuberculosis]|nr:Ser/Thr protein kinase L [Mycobacterium tuberculosis]
MYVGVSGGRFEGDPQSLGFEFGDEATSFFVGIHAGGEVVGAEILVRPAGGQHVPNDDDQLVGDGGDRLLASGSEPEHEPITGQFAGIAIEEFIWARQHARRMVLVWVSVVLAITGLVASAAWTIGSNLSGLL